MNRNFDKEEDQEFKRLMQDNSDLIQRMNDDQERKKQFIDDLKKQIKDNELKKLNQLEQDKEMDKLPRNYLIDDLKRKEMEKLRKDNYKNRLLN